MNTKLSNFIDSKLALVAKKMITVSVQNTETKEYRLITMPKEKYDKLVESAKLNNKQK